jgi:hypothetical protein
MADTDLPNAYGAIKPAPKPRPRPIASPFGMLPTDGLTPQPGPPPGFNVQPDTPAQTNPMASLLASFMPSGDNWKQSLAENLGAPVDAASYALMKLGLPIPRAPTDTPYAYPGPTGSRGTWAPAASVPLGSQNIRGMLDNPPSLDAMLRAMRRPGLF